MSRAELKKSLVELSEYLYFDNNDYLRDKCSNENLLREVIRKFEIEIDSLTEKESVSIAEKTFLYGNLGNLYRVLGNSHLAIESLQRAITLGGNKQINNVILLGEALKYDRQHEQALIKFDEAIKLSVSDSNSVLLDFAFQHKEKCLLELGQTTLALDYFQKAMKIRMEKGDQSLIDSTQKAIDFVKLHGGIWMDFSIIEKAEIQTLHARLSAIQAIEGNPMGVRQLVKGNTNAFAVKNIPGPAFNTVRGLNEHDIQYIDDLFDFYSKSSIDFRIEITPPNSSDALFRLLTEKGFYQSGFHASFVGESSEVKESKNQAQIEVHALKKDEFDLFASIYVTAFDLPSFIQDGIRQNNEILFEVSGWEFFVAYVKDVPVGVAVLFLKDEIATLAAAATLPDYRRIGVQTALLHKRIQVAIEKGAKYITSEAAFGSASHRNMERVGLKLAYTKALWKRF